MTAWNTVVSAHEALLNGSGKLPFFEARGLTVRTIRDAMIGYDKARAAFAYPSIAKGGGLLGIHYKSQDRDAKGKRRVRWGEYAEDLPPKGSGKSPDDPAKVIPFGMETLEGLDPGSQVVLVCGEEDALSARQAGHTSISQPGAGLLEPAYAKAFAGFETVVFYDAGEEAEARKDALTLAEAGASAVRVVEWPADAPNGADLNGRLAEDPGGFEGWLNYMLESARPLAPARAEEPIYREGERNRYGAEGGAATEDEAEERNPTNAELLDRCAAKAELFHTTAGDSYATVPVDGHRETHHVRAKGFRQWLLRGYYERRGRPPGNQALQEALGMLEALAQRYGPGREVHVRVAGHGANLYVDLVNDAWEVVEITAAGWRVIPGEAAPVRFRRARGMLALPTPVRGADGDGNGCDGLLRRFVNVSEDGDLILIVAWLVAALRPTGPYPVMVFLGEQGSAKSTAERMVRALVDPSTVPLRTTPRGERDLYITAHNSHVVAFDNISSLRPWLSDALCRLSTGGGFSTRTLFENREEELFEGTKPVILNGITDVATRSDLLDRALVVTLPPIPDAERKLEAELWREFERARPAILAALFDAVSGALGSVEAIELEGVPRMADFAAWAAAAEASLGWEPGAFLAAYAGNREEATESALDADPIAGAAIKLMKYRDEWDGTATELWDALGELVDESVRRSKAWPKAPNALAGRLKRLAPALRDVGIEYGEYRDGRARRKTLTKIKGAEDRHRRHDRHPEEKQPQNGGLAVDGPDDQMTTGVGPKVETVTQETPANLRVVDGDDDGDDHPRQPSSATGANGRRPTEEQVRRIKQLVSEGMSLKFARQEVLKEGT